MRFWVHLSDRVGGGLPGLGLAGVAAAVDIGVLWWLWHNGEAWFGPVGTLGVMAAIMAGGAILIAVILPKGRWGI